MRVSIRLCAAISIGICLSFVVASPASWGAEGVLQPGETDAFSRGFLGPLRSDFVSPEQLGLQHEELTIPNKSGEKLRAWLITAEGAQQTILFCMGNQGNISTHLVYAQLLVDGGFNVLMFDYQGYGGSSGTATALSIYSDACCAAEYLINQRQVGAKDVGSFGISLGSMLAVAVAAKYELGAVAVEDVLLPGKKFEEITAFLPNDLASKIAIATVRNLILPQIDPLVNANKLQCPMLIMHGENDSLLSPVGALKLAQAVKSPPRVWIMEAAGHAPETLEIYDGEYGQQLNLFFQQAFAGTFVQPTLEMTVTPQEHQWQVDIRVECREEGCYQIVVASDQGNCHFIRRKIDEQDVVTDVVPFEPKHISALRISQTEEGDQSEWVPAKTDRSRSLDDFRQFEADFLQARPAISRMAIFFGSLRPMDWERDPGDLQWLSKHLPAPASIHPDVRPRYARMAAQVFAQMPAKDQLAHVEFIERLLPYLPEEPDRYYQLDNASFQLQLRDEQLAGAVIMLARRYYDDGQLAEARECLRIAFEITNQPWPTLEKIEQLQPNADFYRSVGGPHQESGN